ncbi:MAG: HaeIII family restriction endonuclease [Spirochaetaceae bacterium]|jgi:hypothetical protein|nr:HaeIII family restriction endonuclease [Spirochaetaceae bacterium]
MSGLSGSQMQNGKAFEYAIAESFGEVFSLRNGAMLVKNKAHDIAKSCFDLQNKEKKLLFKRAGNEIAMFLPAYDVNVEKCTNIRLQDDTAGISGDVRDVIINTGSCEIGISAKVNHAAIKHPRLSAKLDFGKVWTGFPCRNQYFDTVSPIFAHLDKLKHERKRWEQITMKDSQIYLPILTAFQDEMNWLYYEHKVIFVENLFKYLLGKYDFYKIELYVKEKEVSIQSVNLYGTLSYGKKWKIPDRIENIIRPNGSANTLIVKFSGGWEISFRLHNASGIAEPSLKFDINFIGISPDAGKHLISLK